MGSCFSKKNVCASPPVKLPEKIQSDTQIEKKKPEEEVHVKKEIFVIKHRKSHETERQRPQEEKNINESKKIATETLENGNISTPTENVVNGNAVLVGAAVRTSSCTKDELDAILIQCGRLSRSSSNGKTALSESCGRKYSGSKRSYDFDSEGNKSDGKNVLDDDAVCKERENRRQNRQSQGRRRTPSRERERDNRSGSRERSGSGGGGRRVSRSPGRRSESPISRNGSNANSNSNPDSNVSFRPGKMVSVPATVSSFAMDKSSNGGEPNSVKRIQVKRNVGGDGVGSRPGASPRAKSPARTRAECQNLSLSRSNSRKADHSPYRRNPLSEIDNNVISQADIQKPNAETRAAQIAEKRPNITKVDSNMTNVNCKTKEQQQAISLEESKIAVNVISSGPHSVTRTRSSRLSRDLDINPETLSNPPNSSYTALLLEDIQNFHQKSTNAATPPPPAFTLPPCVTKACSILEAVADLNSSTGSTTFSEERRRNFINSQISKSNAYVESEVVVDHDDLMEPSFHKYVTVRRGASGGAEMEEQESSTGSNSFVSSQQLLGSSSSWEPNSAESTDRWTSSSSRSISRNNQQRNAITDKHQNVIGRGRIRLEGPKSGATAAST